MSEALVPVVDRREIARPGATSVALPAVIVDAGPAAVERSLEFFAATIANDRTRAAYGQAAGRFLGWCASRGLGLRAIAPLHVAAYIRTHPGSVPTVFDQDQNDRGTGRGKMRARGGPCELRGRLVVTVLANLDAVACAEEQRAKHFGCPPPAPAGRRWRSRARELSRWHPQRHGSRPGGGAAVVAWADAQRALDR